MENNLLRLPKIPSSKPSRKLNNLKEGNTTLTDNVEV